MKQLKITGKDGVLSVRLSEIYQDSEGAEITQFTDHRANGLVTYVEVKEGADLDDCNQLGWVITNDYYFTDYKWENEDVMVAKAISFEFEDVEDHIIEYVQDGNGVEVLFDDQEDAPDHDFKLYASHWELMGDLVLEETTWK